MPYFTILLIVILSLAGTWGVYEKAGRAGWTALVPIYNRIVLCRIARRPVWWLFIPIANIVLGILVWMDVLERFGEPAWRVVLVFIVPFLYLPYLGFSDVRYRGS